MASEQINFQIVQQDSKEKPIRQNSCISAAPSFTKKSVLESVNSSSAAFTADGNLVDDVEGLL